jgi:hypothetical protein
MSQVPVYVVNAILRLVVAVGAGQLSLAELPLCFAILLGAQESRKIQYLLDAILG